ncbi:MAG: response regulator [Burkholderiaceae bacterium]|nr:MAG: response regulator [Burkholderiaceae bacterium]
MKNQRILLVDDMPSIHEDFRKVLLPDTSSSELDAAEALLFGTTVSSSAPLFMLDSAYQGQEALALLIRAQEAGAPYALAFVDMRMPPGWDGIETIERLWAQDPQLQVVVCTAYSDHSWTEILERLDARDRLLILKKPFDPIEVRQLASALTEKWHLVQQAARHTEQLERTVQERTRDLEAANTALHAEIRERKQLEAQLVQTEKMSALGQLVAGIAHEINNPVGFVMSNLGTLQRYSESLFRLIDAYKAAEPGIASPTVSADLAAQRKAVDLDYLAEDIPVLLRESLDGTVRIRQIVQDLKDFSRAESTQDWIDADLHQGIDSTINIAAAEIKYTADVVKDYGPLPLVQCLPAQINQVVMNLVVNAAHAMGPERGTLTIRTGMGDAEAWFEVADTGKGIPSHMLHRIFDPFFTTKPVGQGTGLGLSISYGIIKRHHGRIDVRSEIDQGTTFRVTLPIRQPQEAATPEAA